MRGQRSFCPVRDGSGWTRPRGLLTAEGHIPLVCTPTTEQAAPISGTVEPAGVVFSFEMSVKRVDGSLKAPETA